VESIPHKLEPNQAHKKYVLFLCFCAKSCSDFARSCSDFLRMESVNSGLKIVLRFWQLSKLQFWFTFNTQQQRYT